MIVASLIHCWDNFEQNARMLGRCCSLISNTPIIDRRLSIDQKYPRRGPKFNKDLFCHAIFL